MLDCNEAIDISLTSKNTTTYKDYLTAYESFVDNLQFIPLMGRRGSSTTNSFKMFEDTMKMSDSSVNVEFVKPKYMLYDKMRQIVNDEIKRLVNEYQYHKKVYLYAHDNEKNQAYEKLETMTTEIANLNDCRNKLVDVVSRYHEHNYLKSENIRKEIQEMETEMNDMKNILSETMDDIEKERLVNLYVDKYISRDHKHHSTSQLSALRVATLLPFDMIVKAPIVKSMSSMSVNNDDDGQLSDEEVSTNTSETEQKTKVMDEKLKKKIKKAVKKSSNSQEETEQVAKKEKRRLKRFLFKDLSECQSTKRSGPGFMTREELVDVISQTPSLKAKLPSNYRSMKKKELCEAIDKVKLDALEK